jgi:formate/nitrite transporter FocA (FNT family)
LSAFDKLVAAIIMAGMIIMPIIALSGAALERDWRGLRRMVLGLLFSLGLVAALLWWILHLIGR